MGLFDWFTSKKDALPQQELDLTSHFDPFYHNNIVYIPEEHAVRNLIHIPEGPWGYVTIPVPKTVKTRTQLLQFLVREHDFHLK